MDWKDVIIERWAFDCYKGHKRRAARAGIGFELSFQQGFQIWTASGHLHERGSRGGQYVMARTGDVGPYAVGNVRICTVEENMSERKDSPEGRASRNRLNSIKLRGNTNGIGNKGSTGKTFSEAHRAKIGAKAKGNSYALGYRHTEEAKQRIGAASKDKVVSAETRQKLRIKSSGRVFNAASRKKMSESGKKVWERKRLGIEENPL